MKAECRGTLLGARGPALAGSSPTPWLMLLTEGSLLAGLRSGVRNKKHLMLCFIERRERGEPGKEAKVTCKRKKERSQ